MTVQSNILDAVHDTLPSSVWEKPGDLTPHLKPQHRKWIQSTVTKVLKGAGYTNVDEWLKLVLTGSLTTYQYGKESDCDVSLFVNSEYFPEWSRAELIGLMIAHVDGTRLPGTTFPMQCFVVPPDVHPEDLYKPGLRSGYDLETDEWIEPPDPSRVHDVQREYNDLYIYALEQADKMERLLRYEPDKAVMLWHQIHKRRRRDQAAGKGDYSESNIVYKFLANRGLFPSISEASGEYIAKTATIMPCPRCKHPSMNVESGHCVACGYTIPYDGWEALEGHDTGEAWALDQGLPQHHPIEQGWGPRRFGAPWTLEPKQYNDYDYLQLEYKKNKQKEFAEAYKQHWERVRAQNWDRAYQLGTTPHEHVPAQHMRNDAEHVEILNKLQHKAPKVYPNGYTPEMDSAWHQNYQQQKQQQYVNDPMGRAGEYEDWLDWYRQHAAQHLDPDGTATWDESHLGKLSGPQNRTVTKFVYDPTENHLVLGKTAAEEGEVESHYDLIHKAGLDPKNVVFGQFDPNGHIETFGRPLIRGFGQPDMKYHQSDHRLRQALEQAVPGLGYNADPMFQKWDLEGPPQITYMGDPPTVTPDASNQSPREEGSWVF